MSNITNRPIPLLILALSLVACCYFVMCGLVGYELGRTSVAVDGGGTLAPTPRSTPVQRQPVAAEEETAETLRAAELPQRDLVELAQRLGGLDKAPGLAAMPERFAPGDTLTFWVHDVSGNEFSSATAVLRFETPHAYWWVQEGYAVDENGLARSAQNFEEQTYPTVRRLFGSEPLPGIDNDPHVYLFLGDVPGVAGYFSGPDEYPAMVRAYSNEHEMFYINLDYAVPGSERFDGILAHEFQHMVHWAVDRNEDSWVNEGLSVLAADVSGYDAGGYDRLFLSSPDTQLNAWPELEDSGPHYGASYLFLAYFLDRYGETAVSQLVAEQLNGAAGFEAVLTEFDPGMAFDTLFADWVIANYLDDEDLAAGSYAYQILDPRRPAHSAQHETYPVDGRASVNQYAADYILLEGEGDVTVTFEGSTLVPVVGNEVHGGDYQWCAVRGDEGDATLTHAVDLSGVNTATLSAWMWYDLEVDYDYLYFEVSADGGGTWTILSNDDTTTSDPNDSSYGPAFTGLSGGGKNAQWTEQVFDLSAYTGGEVLIRLEVITDESVNHPGVCIDDVSVPEAGFQDGAEDGPGGWEAAGWVRITDDIPQDFVVQLVTFQGAQVGVESLALSDSNRGSATIRGLGDEVDRAVLVVAAIAPVTTEPATYSYYITPTGTSARSFLDVGWWAFTPPFLR